MRNWVQVMMKRLKRMKAKAWSGSRVVGVDKRIV